MGKDDWIIGAFLALAANFLCDVGVQLQKFAHVQIIKEELERQQSHSLPIACQQRSYVLHPLWISGFIVQGIGNLVNVLAVTYAPQTVVAPVGCLTLIINMFLTSMMQKETVSRGTIYTTLGITFGAIMSIVFVPKPDTDTDTVHIIIENYRTIYFLVYGVSVFLVMTTLWILCQAAKSSTSAMYRFCFPAFCGIVGGQVCCSLPSSKQMFPFDCVLIRMRCSRKAPPSR